MNDCTFASLWLCAARSLSPSNSASAHLCPSWSQSTPVESRALEAQLLDKQANVPGTRIYASVPRKTRQKLPWHMPRGLPTQR